MLGKASLDVLIGCQPLNFTRKYNKSESLPTPDVETDAKTDQQLPTPSSNLPLTKSVPFLEQAQVDYGTEFEELAPYEI